MREILFRGKRIDSGEWVYGNYAHRENDDRTWADNYILPQDYSRTKYKIHPDTLDQYIGLTDKNGTKIFEGDIATLISRSPFNYGYAVNVKFLFINGCFIAYILDRNCLIPVLLIRDIPKDTEITVIGNIYDNPELTKGYRK